MPRKAKDVTTPATTTTTHTKDTTMTTSTAKDTSTMTLAEMAAQANMPAPNASGQAMSGTCFERFIEIGQAYFVFTTSFYYLGRAVDVDSEGVVFAEAVWVTYTGAVQDMLATGKIMTALPMKRNVYMPRTHLDAVWGWEHAIPTTPCDKG